MTSLLLPPLSSSLIDSLPSLNVLCLSKTGSWFIQDGRKAVWRILYVSVAFFPSLKHNFIAYLSSKMSLRPDCIFEIHQLWESGFSRVYSNCCCSCVFEPEIIKKSPSSHKMYSNNILNFHEFMIVLNSCTKKSLHTHWRHHLYTHIYIYIVNQRQAVSFYQNSSVWLHTQDARSRDRNPSNFTLDKVLDFSANKRPTLAKGILKVFI